MNSSPGIQFLTNSQIDKQRWDETIQNASGGLIYGRSFYLDAMCRQWCALVAPEYSWILPITGRKKWGIAYLYQPAFTQQLGVFAKDGVTIPYEDITAWLKRRYRFFEVNWNYTTPIADLVDTLKITTATNMVLNLFPGYRNIAGGYKKDLAGNLKRSRQFNMIYEKTTEFKQYIKMFRQFYGDRMPHVTDADFTNFTNMAAYACENEMLLCRQVSGKDGNIMAAALMLNDGRRLYNMMNTTTPTGRQTEANCFLLDSVVREFAGQDIMLDFEGSDVAGIKRFYENFGAVCQPYFMLGHNALPWPLRLFKQ